MDEFVAVCRAEDVVEGIGKVVRVHDKLVALFREGDAIRAIDDTCPHMGASLAGGCVENGVVTCSWHAWRFRLSDGAWADNPRIKIGAYSVRVEDGTVQIALPTPKTPTLSDRPRG
jgi:nitrite reductase (NADH) small subunit/3-phenylpropionate/trans-cinnamate dioxygenase ferredoxin subunit